MTYLLIFVLGAAAVLQGGWNKQIADEWGLGSAVFVNSLIVLVYASVSLIAFKVFSPDGVRVLSPVEWTKMGPFVLLPALGGILFVIGVPYAISKVGGLSVFVGLVASQILFGFLWDQFVGDVALSYQRLFGSLLAIAGAVLVALD